ncbi:MAG: hypothetical protein L3J61_05100 [Ghiorsea sp.]|nr:hypothetical protein [Ghiorsea sp.]
MQEFLAFIQKISKYDFDGVPVKGLNILCKNLRFKNISTSAIYQAGKTMKNAKFRKDGKNALIAKTSLGYAFSRVFQVGTDLQGIDKVEVFKGHQLQQALQWLDLEHMTPSLETIIEQCEMGN